MRKNGGLSKRFLKRSQKEKAKGIGDDLLSRGVALRVPSALAGLTAGFGKEPGVPPPLKSPITFAV